MYAIIHGGILLLFFFNTRTKVWCCVCEFLLLFSLFWGPCLVHLVFFFLSSSSTYMCTSSWHLVGTLSYYCSATLVQQSCTCHTFLMHTFLHVLHPHTTTVFTHQRWQGERSARVQKIIVEIFR